MRAAAGLGSGVIAGSAADAHAGPLSGGTEGFIDTLAGQIGKAGRALWDVLAAAPDIPAAFAAAWRAMAAGGDAAGPVALALVLGMAVLLVPGLVQRLAGAGDLSRPTAWATLRAAVRRLLLDIGALLVMTVAAALLVRLFLPQETPVHAFAVAVVGSFVRWRLAMLLPLVLLRPGEPGLRLVQAGEARVRSTLVGAGATLAVLIAFYTLMPVFVRAGIAIRPAQAFGVLVGTLAAGLAFATLARFAAGTAEVPRHLVLAARAIIALVFLAWAYGIVGLDFDLYHAAVFSALLVFAVAAVDRFLVFAIACCRPAEAAAVPLHEPQGEPASADGGPQASVPDAGAPRLMQVLVTVRRIVLAVAATALAAFFVRLWAVDILELVPRENWFALREALYTAIAILVLGYILFELLRAWTQLKFGPRSGAGAAHGDHDAMGAGQPAGRLASVLPLLQGFLGAVIVATALLVALSHLGVNIGPILAAAGIFGLAFSFGSQALVRDIVSGIFYLADDAFRVGEYIQAGSHKGMVERISVRSLRIRHQNGQFHTIPYGQLGAVTNFSRDWATVKFNLRLARDSDVEQARKLAKKIGQELLGHEEYGKDFIGQLKMQGVADVQENALVCRFKFTVKPGRQALIQREAVKRLFNAFTESGIRFASNAVVVQGGEGGRGDASAAAAADLSRHIAEERAQAQG